MITTRALTALQYLEIISKLPNPNIYWEEVILGKKSKRLRVAYIEHPLNAHNVVVNKDDASPERCAYVKEVEFEVVPTRQVWYWQPVQAISIVPIELTDHYYQTNI